MNNPPKASSFFWVNTSSVSSTTNRKLSFTFLPDQSKLLITPCPKRCQCLHGLGIQRSDGRYNAKHALPTSSCFSSLSLYHSYRRYFTGQRPSRKGSTSCFESHGIVYTSNASVGYSLINLYWSIIYPASKRAQSHLRLKTNATQHHSFLNI